jgi:hypothetical protein
MLTFLDNSSWLLFGNGAVIADGKDSFRGQPAQPALYGMRSKIMDVFERVRTVCL